MSILDNPAGHHTFRVTIAHKEGDEWIKTSKVITTRDWRGSDILTLAFRGEDPGSYWAEDSVTGPRLESVEYLGVGFDMPSVTEEDQNNG